MPLLETLLNKLESVDRQVTRVVRAVRGEPAPIVIPPQPQRVSRKEAAEVLTPLGNPAVAVQVYGRDVDPWTGRATRILKDRAIPFEFTELDAKGNERLAPRLENETSQRITPFIYIRGEFVGGFNALDEIERLGQLDDMIKTPDERAKSARGVAIVIPKRGAEEAPPGER